MQSCQNMQYGYIVNRPPVTFLGKLNATNHHLQCLPVRLGSIVQRGIHREYLVRARADHAYQLLGASGSHSGIEGILEGRHFRAFGASIAGQSHSSSLYQQHGRHGVSSVNRGGKGIVDVISGQQHFSVCSGSIRYHSGYRIQTLPDYSHWMLYPWIFLEIDSAFGPLEVDLFASRVTYQTCNFISWRPDPVGIPFKGFPTSHGVLLAGSWNKYACRRSAGTGSISLEGSDLVSSRCSGNYPS